MDAIVSKYVQCDDILEAYVNGTIKSRQLRDMGFIISIQEKLINDYIAVRVLAIKGGDKETNQLKKANLLNNKICFPTVKPKGLGVVCELSNKVISRHECLDISGHPPEGFDCSGCEHFATTRQMLVDGNE